MEIDKRSDARKVYSIDELIEENKNLNALVQNVPGGVMCCEANVEDGLKLLEYSEGFLRLIGYSAEELKTRFDSKFRYLIYEPDWAETIRTVTEQMSRGNTKQIEYRLMCGDGTLKTIYDQGQLVRRNGRDVYYCILTDVTEQRAITEELRLSLERHRIIMEQTSDIIFEWDIENDRVMWSDNWEKKFGYKPFYKNVKEEITENEHIHQEDRNELLNLYYLLLSDHSYVEAEIRIQRSDGMFLWCRIRASLQLGLEGDKKKVIGVIMDINDVKCEAEKLKERAEKDALTGVYNKGTVEMMAAQYFAHMQEQETAAFFMIDIDDFKYINDVYGHLSGDVLLTEIAMGLRRIFRAEDIIGRIGGDEFAVIMKGISEKNIVEQKAKEIINIFKQLLKEESYVFSSSIGIAFVPDDGHDFESVYKNADIALYQAKASGKDTWRIYENGLRMEGALGGAFAMNRKIDICEHVWQDHSGIVSYIFSALYGAVNVQKGIEDILKIIGTQFGVSRTYIFEYSEDGKVGFNTFEWCNEGITPQKENLQGVTEEISGDYYKNFSENGIFYCRDVKELENPPRGMLEEQGIKSMLQCLIMDRGEKRGFIGFDECEINRLWTKEQIETLSVAAQIISVFLRKERAQSELYKVQQGKNV